MRKLLFVLIVQFLYIGSRAQKIMLPVEIEMKDNVPENAKTLLMALQDNIRKYEANFGTIKPKQPEAGMPVGKA